MFFWDETSCAYGKDPKILYIKYSDKMTYMYANSADSDQTAPEGAVWSGSTLFAIPLIILETIAEKAKFRPTKSVIYLRFGSVEF